MTSPGEGLSGDINREGNTGQGKAIRGFFLIVSLVLTTQRFTSVKGLIFFGSWL